MFKLQICTCKKVKCKILQTETVESTELYSKSKKVLLLVINHLVCKSLRVEDTTVLTHLQVQVNNVVVVKILDSATYLSHEQTTVRLCQVEIISSNSLKQLASVKILHHENNFRRSLECIDKSETK